MSVISASEFKSFVDQNGGDEEAARALLRQQGLSVENDEMSDLAARPDMTALQGLLTGQRKSIGDLYDTITQNIQKRYRAPDINDMLIAIGTGMMSAPGENDAGGFAGAVQRGLRGIGPYAQSRRAYANDINNMMSKVEIQKAQDLAALEGKYATGAASLLKPRPRRTAINSRDEVVDLDTAEIISRPPPAIGTIKTGRDGKRYSFTNATSDGDEYNIANWQEVR
jgi:hypothetical protein